jgi:hypothetical protein
MLPIAAMAAMCLAAHKFDKRSAAELASELPNCLLVAPHQRCMNDKAVIHPEPQGRPQCFERIVAAINGLATVDLSPLFVPYSPAETEFVWDEGHDHTAIGDVETSQFSRLKGYVS